MQFIEDEKLPADVVRKEYSHSSHALCCLEWGLEYAFNPQDPQSIGRPLYMLALHECADSEGQH